MAGRRVADILVALVAEGPARTWPALLVDSCRTATRVTGVGLALMGEAGPGGVVATTGRLARELEELQFSLGEGPCVEASRSGRPVLCPDLGDGGARWPSFAEAGASAGLAAAFAFPLQAGAIAVGVLDLYRDTPGPISTPELDSALAHAGAATAVLLHLQERSDRDGAAAPGQDLRGLLDLTDRRAVVHQAAGMISVQLSVDVSVALLRLRAHAWANGRPLVEVATAVVARQLQFDHSDSGTSDGPDSPGADGSPGKAPPSPFEKSSSPTPSSSSPTPWSPSST